MLNKAFYDFGSKPVIVLAAAGDCGYLKTFNKDTDFDFPMEDMYKFFINIENSNTLFNKASTSLLGALAAVETIKVLLDIGGTCEGSLQFNLAADSFVYGEEALDSVNYSADFTTISSLLKQSRILIVGSGGLGSPAAYTLALMGIGNIGLVDYDIVEISNLNRQILHSTDKIGMTKVKSAEEFLKMLNPEITINTFENKFSFENAEELVKSYDIVIDGLDNLPTRYLLNDICYFLKKPLIEAGVLGFNGLATVIKPDEGPCYRCIFPEIDDNSPIPSCSETGVLGAVPGVMGIIQAAEAIKTIIGIGTTLINKLLMFDALNMDISILEINKEPGCELCGNNPVIDSLQNYEFICKNKV